MKKIILSDEKVKEIQEIHNSGIYWCNLSKKVNVSKKVLDNYLSEGKLIKVLHKRKLSNETKSKISKARKRYLKDNPDKHPWKRNSKFKSEPCEYFKKKLNKLNILFSPEFTDPEWNRFYAIDIAFPTHKIGIEINGNQHYNNDGTLKKYYIKRKEFLINLGWNIFDIHYSVVYNDIISNNIINDIKKYSLSQGDYDKYFEYYIKNKQKYFCDDCGVEITKYGKSGKCTKCCRKDKRKIERPTFEQLLNDIETLGYRGSGKKYGVSDNAIRKWVRNYELI